MTAPEGNPTTPADPNQTVVSSIVSQPGETQPTDGRPTIDLRDAVRTTNPDLSNPGLSNPDQGNTVDLRDTVLVPAQGGPATPPAAPPPPVEVLRFGPGVPAVIATAPVLAAEPPAPPRRLRRKRALNLVLTVALAGLVIWLLWPAGKLHVSTVSLQAKPTVVACEQSADVVATVRTNGNAGQLKYRWTRNDAVGSGTLVQSLARGQHSVNLHLRWTFHGPGSYDARATVQLISPGAQHATVNFRYAC